MITLFDHQVQALEAEAQHRIDHPEETRLAVVMATGLGKGMIIAARAVRYAEGEHDRFFRADEVGVVVHGGRDRVLVLAHTDEIVSDLAQRCRLLATQSEFPITVGIVKAELDETDADIVIASTQTLLSPERRARITDVGLVIVDECELYAAPEWSGVLRHFGCFGIQHAFRSLNGGAFCLAQVGTPDEDMPCAYSMARHHAPTPALGFTATLKRGDGQGLGTLWQNVAFTRDISWGVRKGYLVQPVGHRLEIDMGAGHPFSTDAVDQDWQLIENLAPEKIVEKWIELSANLCRNCLDAVDSLPEGTAAMPSWCDSPDCGVNAGVRPTIAFMPLVRSARALQTAFTHAGVSSRVIHGEMAPAQRRLYIAEYNAGKVQVLVNAMVLTRGFDAPKTSCVIIGRPTKSVNLGIQMAGRGLRRDPLRPVEEQDCILIYVSDATTDLFCHADLSDRPVDRKAEGPLTVMEDQWDIGKALDEAEREKLWTGGVSAVEFDPLARRSSKVWRATKHGTPFLPIGKEGQYVFLVGTSVFVREPVTQGHCSRFRIASLHRDLPDLELALQLAEDEATERGGDVGKLLADRDRPWRKEVPKHGDKMVDYALKLGLAAEVEQILNSRAGGKAGKVSDLISKVEATRALEPMVAKIKEVTA